jgi:K+-transporting ATPase ATPase B chain
MRIRIRKGATDAIKKIVTHSGNTFPTEVEERVREISQNGGTPLVVSENEKALGVIELQDIIKPVLRTF